MPILAVSSVTSGPLEQEVEKLFREYYQMLYRTAYSILDHPADAEEVPQAIFLRLLRGGITPDMRGNPKGYLYRAAVNLALNMIRARKRQALAVGADRMEIAGDSSDPNTKEETHRRPSDAIAE